MNFDFGSALNHMKAGFRVSRAGWNGKGMWLTIIDAIQGEQLSLDLQELNDGKKIELLQWIGMKTADDKFVPWLASQTDMLAEDWGIVGLN